MVVPPISSFHTARTEYSKSVDPRYDAIKERKRFVISHVVDCATARHLFASDTLSTKSHAVDHLIWYQMRAGTLLKSGHYVLVDQPGGIF